MPLILGFHVYMAYKVYIKKSLYLLFCFYIIKTLCANLTVYRRLKCTFITLST